jgi:FkbM family methyltransferase
MKKIINKILRLINRKSKSNNSIISSYVYNELQQILMGQKIRTIDVGGAVNLQPHFNKLIGNAEFYIFEPDQRSYDDLVSTVNRYSHPSDFHYINKALSGKGGIRTLHLTNVPTGTSILDVKEDAPFHSKDSNYFYPMKKIDIETFTLNTILNKESINIIDSIKLDVQGAELEIIRGIDNDRLNFLNSIEMEIGMHENYVNQTTFCETLNFMKEKGFGLFDIRVSRSCIPNFVDNISYQKKYFNTHDNSPSVSARIWEVDAIFFREPSWIKENKISKERILRIIAMYCVYNFFAEAIQILNTSYEEKIFTQIEWNNIKKSIINWNKKEQEQTKDVDVLLNKVNYFNWAQYMWTTYPSN